MVNRHKIVGENGVEHGDMVTRKSFVSRARGVAVAAVTGLFLVTGCASTSGPATSNMDEVNDPYEELNRDIFDFNMAVDEAVLRPVAKVYRDVTPEFARDMVGNFLINLKSPVVFLNDILQGQFERAGETLVHFIFNSTFGIGGLFHVTQDGINPRHDEDFGQTLAVWGVEEGPFVVLPFFGPTTLRDVGGRAGDTVMDPFFWWTIGIDHREYNLIRGGVDAVHLRSQAIEVLDDMKANSVDFYASMRSLYRQRRNAEILNGESNPDEDVPELDWDLPDTPISKDNLRDQDESNSSASLN